MSYYGWGLKMSNEYIEELESAIIDLLNGNFEKDIQLFTGCSEENAPLNWETYSMYSMIL